MCRRITSLGGLLLAGLLLAACPAPPPNLTPQAQVAYQADQVVLRVQELENAAIDWATQSDRNIAPARVVVQFCVTAAPLLKAAPQGWQQALLSAWLAAKSQPDYPKAPSPALATLLGGMDTLIVALQPPAGGQ